MKSFVLVTLDSCRLDSFQRASTPFFDALGTCVPGRSHGDSTLPGHKALLHGLLPTTRYSHPKSIFMGPTVARHFASDGYRCLGAVSLPYCSSVFGFDAGFHAFDDKWADFKGGEVYIKPLEQSLAFFTEQMKGHDGPFFLFLNVGETHMPYRHSGQPRQAWEEVHGQLAFGFNSGREDCPQALLDEMHLAQIEMVEWVDGKMFEWASSREELGEAVWFVTADHGEMFGEHHRWGHGLGGYSEELNVPVVCSDWGFIEEHGGAV